MDNSNIAIIGVPKEIKTLEKRVGLTPDSTKNLVENGFRVFIESGAGEGSYFSNEQYKEAGAEIVANVDDVWNKVDLVVKVKEPQSSEFKYLRNDLVLFTYLHLAAYPQVMKACVDSGVTAIAYDAVEVDGELPLLKPMSVVAGRIAAQEVAHYLMAPHGGRGQMLGGVQGVGNASIAIVGGGNVGQAAAEVTLGMGAEVTLIDIDESVLAKCKKKCEYFGDQLKLVSSRDYLSDNISKFDAIIGAVLVPGNKAVTVVTKEMISKMVNGSVVADVAIDQGGCIETSRETSHSEPVYSVDGVLHYCVGNIPGSVPISSTLALNNATRSFVLELARDGVEAFGEKYPDAINVSNHEVLLDYLKN